MSDELFFSYLRRKKAEWGGGNGLSQAERDEGNAVLTAMNEPIVITAEPVPHFQTIATYLESEEGRVEYAYADSLGFLTIGVGRLIDKRKGGRLSGEEIDHLLANDIKAKLDGISAWPAWQAVKDDPVRSAALIGLAFQLGVEGLSEFTTTLGFLAQQQWQAAADAVLRSLWARQTPNRANRVAKMFITGAMQ